MVGDRLAAIRYKKLPRQLMNEWRVVQEAKGLSNVWIVSRDGQAKELNIYPNVRR